jgi:ABC-2 type transport system permease protein
VLTSISHVVGWTPLGAVWAAPADAAAGSIGTAVAKLLIAAVFVGVLWFSWRALVALMLVTPQHAPQAKQYHGLGWFAVFPASVAGAIAARSLTYWFRDARYHVSLLIIPIVPFMMIIPLAVAGVPTNYLALLPMPVMALFLSWAIHNDVAYDNTAIWVHISASIRGRADRIGRVITPILVGIPVILIGSVICSNLFGNLGVLPSLIGVSVCILLSGLGLSSIMSASFPYPAVRPGDSPFMQPQAGGSAASLIQSVSFAATFALAIPSLIFAGLGLTVGEAWAWASLVFGIAFGCVILYFGVTLGGRIFERRGPELLAFSMRN